MILAKLKSGATYRELSLEFGISTCTIQNWRDKPKRKMCTVHTYKINLDDLAQNIIDYPDAFQRDAVIHAVSNVGHSAVF